MAPTKSAMLLVRARGRASLRGGMPTPSGHYAELKAALDGALPALLGALALALVLVATSRVSASVEGRRRQVGLAGLAVPVGAATGFLVAYWIL